MFKYSADRLPVTIILIISLVDILLYFYVDSTSMLVVYWLVMLIPKLNVCAWNHHHQHTLTFKSKFLNRLLEFFYALHTGASGNTWLLHHVLGHHKNYLNQIRDESRWQRKCGKVMGEIEYSINVALTAYYRAYQVGKKYPRLQKNFLRSLFVVLSFVVVMSVFKPLAALFLFVLPMLSGLILTAWVTYDHHSGLNTKNIFLASRNNVNRFYNLVTGNLGYHTAHHYKQGVHWSQLPSVHDEIKDKIPEHLIKHSLF